MITKGQHIHTSQYNRETSALFARHSMLIAGNNSSSVVAKQ